MEQLHKQYIEPILNELHPKKMLEIGVLKGRHTYSLLTWCEVNCCELISVDPTPWQGHIPDCLKTGAEGYKYKRGRQSEADFLVPTYIERIFSESMKKSWTCKKSLSINYLSTCSERFDIVFIDGDHNYYTVINELTLLSKLLSSEGCIFIHDISNPSCAFTDFYYDYTTIPKDLIDKEKQGIITAIDDFISLFPSFIFQTLTEENNGLGIVRHCDKNSYGARKGKIV